MKIIKEKSCSKIKIKSYLINLYLLAKIQNWPFNFHSFSFKSSNFQFCQFSLLTFNFCQCKIPLNLNYGLSLMSLKRCRFSFFFFFEIKKKKKTLKGNDIPFPLNTTTIYIQTKPLSPPIAPTNPTSTTSSLPFPQTPCVKVVSTTPPLAKPQRPQSTAFSSVVETSHPMSAETVCQQQLKKLLSNTAL